MPNEEHTMRQKCYRIQSEINGNEYESSRVDRIVRQIVFLYSFHFDHRTSHSNLHLQHTHKYTTKPNIGNTQKKPAI